MGSRGAIQSTYDTRGGQRQLIPSEENLFFPPKVSYGNIIQYGVGSTRNEYSMCVCVCFLSIYSGRQVRWLYQPGSHRRKVTHDFSSTFLLRCMPLFFPRERFSRSFPSSTVKPIFVFNRSPLDGHFYFIFLVRKNPSYRDSNSRPNVIRTDYRVVFVN